jgi:hypothetical protein
MISLWAYERGYVDDPDGMAGLIADPDPEDPEEMQELEEAMQTEWKKTRKHKSGNE